MIFIYKLQNTNNHSSIIFLYNSTTLLLILINFSKLKPKGYKGKWKGSERDNSPQKKHDEQNNAYTKSTFSGKESTKIWKEMHRLNIP